MNPPAGEEVNKLFRLVTKVRGSDLYLKPGQPPMIRLCGDLRPIQMRSLTREDLDRWLPPLLGATEAKTLDDEGRVNFTHVVGRDECRFRVSIFKQEGELSLSSRYLKDSPGGR